MTQEEENKAQTRRFYEDIWHGGNLGRIDEYIAPGVLHIAEQPEVGTYKDNLLSTRSKTPDIHYTLSNMIAEGDRVAWQWVGRWTDPETKKPATMEGMTMHRLADGKIVERRAYGRPASVAKE